jgi:hypothetical protein
LPFSPQFSDASVGPIAASVAHCHEKWLGAIFEEAADGSVADYVPYLPVILASGDTYEGRLVAKEMLTL